MQKLISSNTLFIVALLALVLSGCSPAAKKARYLEQADRNFASGNYAKAEIDYKNVLQIENLNPQAIGRLGLIYSEQGRTGQAIVYVVKGRELQPENLELRLKFAQLNLASGNQKDARAEANYILERRPKDPDAPLLLVATIAKPQDIVEVRTRLQGLPKPASEGAPALTALGLIELRQGHLKEAESILQQALAADPKYAGVYAALGSLYGFQKENAKAAQAFKQAAEASPPHSPRRTQYAQFMIVTGNLAAGKQYLEEITRTTPDFLTAWSMLAELALMEKKFEDCAGYIGKVIAQDALNLEALFIRGRLLLAQGNTDKGVEEFEQLLRTYPRLPQIHYQLGLAYLASSNAGKAAGSFKQALALAPGLTDASIALANLELKTGNSSSAIARLKPLVQQRPDNAQARFLLAEAYRAQKDFDSALAIYSQLERDFPGNAQTSLLTGLVLLQQNQLAGARQAFTKALERAPGLLPALEQLVTLDLQEKQPDAAIQRIEAELARNPSSAGAHILLAKIYALKADTGRAEEEFKKAIALQPDGTNAYYLLAQLYIGAKEDPKALTNLQTVVSRNPKDIGALMLIALIREQQKNYPAARDAYEQILAVSPKFINALNNVAYLYSEQLNEPDKAFAAAKKARELLPQEPHTADTLGWILFKKNQYRWALSLLEESALKLPDEPEVFYHLGMARYMLGQDEAARQSLQHALALAKDFPGAANAAHRLSLLELDNHTTDIEAHALLEKALAEQPGDPVALDRLSALQERAGATDKAIATNLKAVQANPSTATPLINLARLYAVSKETSKALEMAKAAHKVAPDDQDTTHTLGQLAYRLGDFAWAANLLQAAAQKNADDPELLYEEGEALYTLGRVAEAETALRGALSLTEARPSTSANDQSDRSFAHAEQARRFLEMTELSNNPTVSAIERVEQLLQTEPDHVPALMALGAIDEQRADAAAAGAAYEKALKRFPDFSPAKLRLAILGAAKIGFDEKAYDWAQQARTTYPDDPDLAKALGVLLYRKGGEPGRVVNLLKQSAVTRTNDAELLYYLGMAQLQSKDLAGSRQSLQKAIAAGLPPPLSAEAGKTLSGLK
jgi:tetratricopeptide (TPR) repeat protein